jgi:hypothetical protein
MARRRGWRRNGRKGRFNYYDSRGQRITDPAKLARIEELVIPPAWKDVWISSLFTRKPCSSCSEYVARGSTVNCASLFDTLRATTPVFEEANPMARKTVLVCDNCGAEVGEGKGATLRLNYTDARRGSKQADLCDNCAGQMPGRAAARRGRRPKTAAA